MKKSVFRSCMVLIVCCAILSLGSACYAEVIIADFGQAEANLTNSRGLNQEIEQQPSSGKRIMGEVFMAKSNWPFGESGNDVVKCEEYKIYLLKEQKSDAKGELILDAKQSYFDITVSADQLKKYSYIEFVSPYGNKVLKLDDLTDNQLKIFLLNKVGIKKPAIYLYPTQKLQITITHNFKGKILNTYPRYTDHWIVVAEPDGTLLNMKDHRSYKYLFWDGVYAFPNEHYHYKTGFYVKNEDYVSFLQSKLTSIGLNENEINDFIVYWLPVMSHHNNCFVYFRINDNIDGSSILETKPAVETTIRVFMEFSGIDNISTIHKLPGQILPSFIRKGFTLVEWGGAEIGTGSCLFQ